VVRVTQASDCLVGLPLTDPRSVFSLFASTSRPCFKSTAGPLPAVRRNGTARHVGIGYHPWLWPLWSGKAAREFRGCCRQSAVQSPCAVSQNSVNTVCTLTPQNSPGRGNRSCADYNCNRRKVGLGLVCCQMCRAHPVWPLAAINLPSKPHWCSLSINQTKFRQTCTDPRGPPGPRPVVHVSHSCVGARDRKQRRFSLSKNADTWENNQGNAFSVLITKRKPLVK